MAAPDRTSLVAIVAAGRDVLEEGGQSGLTMQAVARRVGVRAPSLYKRVRDRDALVGLVATATVDDLTERLTTIEESLSGLARAYRAFALERPEGFRLILSTAADAGAVARVTAPVLRLAADLVGEAEALEAARLITAWVVGFISMELAGAFRLDGDLENAFEFALERLPVALHRPGGHRTPDRAGR